MTEHNDFPPPPNRDAPGTFDSLRYSHSNAEGDPGYPPASPDPYSGAAGGLPPGLNQQIPDHELEATAPIPLAQGPLQGLSLPQPALPPHQDPFPAPPPTAPLPPQQPQSDYGLPAQGSLPAVPPVNPGYGQAGNGPGYPGARMPIPAVEPGPSSQAPLYEADSQAAAAPSGGGGSLGSVTPGGAFLMALGTNLALILLVVVGMWAFPVESRALLRNIAQSVGLAPSEELAAVPGVGASADRLEILELEDRAIFRGERTALEQLLRLSRELDPADLTYDAVQASLIRIGQRYQLSQGEIPAPLDPREILPGSDTEKDLPITAVVDVLRNRRQPATKRQRAAYLLSTARQSPSAQNALFHAIQDDPNLGVVRQSFQSFQELTGYPGRDPFDARAIDQWWARNAASFVGQTTP
ncbi:MAG: hypothetical protein AAF191_00650 [Verrucomicrobiota bacterium]